MSKIIDICEDKNLEVILISVIVVSSETKSEVSNLVN